MNTPSGERKVIWANSEAEGGGEDREIPMDEKRIEVLILKYSGHHFNEFYRSEFDFWEVVVPKIYIDNEQGKSQDSSGVTFFFRYRN